VENPIVFRFFRSGATGATTSSSVSHTSSCPPAISGVGICIITKSATAAAAAAAGNIIPRQPRGGFVQIQHHQPIMDIMPRRRRTKHNRQQLLAVGGGCWCRYPFQRECGYAIDVDGTRDLVYRDFITRLFSFSSTTSPLFPSPPLNSNHRASSLMRRCQRRSLPTCMQAELTYAHFLCPHNTALSNPPNQLTSSHTYV